MPILLNVFLGLPQALSSIQMMLVFSLTTRLPLYVADPLYRFSLICVVTDVFAAVALCFEKPEEGLLRRKPRNVKNDRLVDWKLLLHAYGVLGVTESLCAMSMAFWWVTFPNHTRKLALTFLTRLQVPRAQWCTLQGHCCCLRRLPWRTQ